MNLFNPPITRRSQSLDHNLEGEDHLLVVPAALGGAEVAVGEGEPPGQPHLDKLAHLTVIWICILE